MTTHLPICLPTAERGGVRSGRWMPASSRHPSSGRPGGNAPVRRRGSGDR